MFKRLFNKGIKLKYIFVLTFFILCFSFACQKVENTANIKNERNYAINYVSIYDKTKPIYVIGHKNPDSDTVCSAIAFASFLKDMGFDAKPLTSGEPNAESTYALNKFNVAKPDIRLEAGNDQYILVDHCISSQSIDCMSNAVLLGVLDHHNMGDIKSNEPIMYISMPFGSTCTSVYYQYELYDVNISKEMAGMMLTGILSDTLGLKSETVTEYDKVAVKSLMKIAEVTDYNAYTKELLDKGNNYDNMTVEKIVHSDLKYYDSGNIHFAVGTVQSTDATQLRNIETKIDEYMKDNFNELSANMCFMMMVDVMNAETKLLCYGDGAIETARKAFDIASGDIIIKNGLSRKKQIIPPLLRAMK